MFATLKRNRDEMIDGSSSSVIHVPVKAGRHEIERIPNPFFPDGGPWLVLKGTKIGMAEKAWRQWTNGVIVTDLGNSNFGKPADWGDSEIIIEE